jgi:TonB family protein
MDRAADNAAPSLMQPARARLHELPCALPAALALSLAVHIGAMLWFGPISIHAPQPAAFDTVEVSLISEPAPQPIPRSPPPRLPRRAPTAPASATPAPPSDAPAPAEDQALVQARYAAGALNNPKPAYPLAARRRGEQGRVILRAYVRADGTAGEVAIKQSSGSVLLDEAARQAVRRWHFLPARRGAVAIDAWVEIPMTFRLEGQAETENLHLFPYHPK